MKVLRYVNCRPYRVEIPASDREKIERVYLEYLRQPRLSREIQDHLVVARVVTEEFAQGLHLTLSSMFFGRNRMIDNSFGTPGPYTYWVTPHGLEYLETLRAKGDA
jgi:hypothetical protein